MRHSGGVNRTGSALVWTARAAWLSLAATGGVYSTGLDGAGDAVRGVAWVGLLAVWATVLLALLVPSTASLTICRLLAPAAPATAAVALAAGGDASVGLAAVVGGLVAVAAMGMAEFGESFVQASAYGSERRLLLRPPGPLVPVVAVLWTVVAASAVSGPLLVADGASTASIVAGIGLCLVAVAGGWLIGTRSHHLARRWLVLVPAGLVVHDRFVLADTFMVPRARVRSIALAPADTEAADLTGNALGPAVEIVLDDMETVVLAPDRDHPGGRALHVLSMLVSPSRPGRALRAWFDG